MLGRPDAKANVRVAALTFTIVAVAGQLAVGMRAAANAPVTGDEPFYLLTTQSLASDGDLDLRDEYRGKEYREFWDSEFELWKQMTPAPDGRLLSPHDPGLSILVLPAYEVGGLRGVQRFLVLLWAGAMAAAAVLALRFGAPPWAAVLAAVAVGAGPPGVVYASQVYPEGPAALLVAVGLLVAIGPSPPSSRSRRDSSSDSRENAPRTKRMAVGSAVAMAAVVAGLAWLGVKYVPLAGLLAGTWAWRQRPDRRALAIFAVLAGVAAGHSIWWHQSAFGGFTPYTTNVVWSGEGDAAIVAGHLGWSGRSYRLYGLFLDARFGLFRWLPVAVLAPLGVARRTLLPAAVLAVAVLMGTFVSITMMGWWFPGRMLVAALPAVAVLLAGAAARLPRTAAVLTAWSLAIAAALVWSARTGGVRLAVDPFTLGPPLPPAWAFPDFRAFGGPEIVLSLAWGAALILLMWRSSSSSTATRWPTAPSSPSPPTWRQPAAR